MRKKKKPDAPIWLRRLGRVKDELRGYEWPTEQDGMEQTFALMQWAIEMLQTRCKGSSKQSSLLMANFSKEDYRWIKRWREERARVFNR